MGLSEQEKQRIREEELFRMQVREEYQKAHRPRANQNWRTAVFWVVSALAAIALWAAIRHPSSDNPDQRQFIPGRTLSKNPPA
jgi:hypothetical protein